MATSLESFLSVVNRFVDSFIPPQIAADREATKQARIFLISHLFGPFIGNTVPFALYLFDPTPGFDILVLAASITGFWIFPFVLRAIGHYNVLALLSIQNLMFCILWSCYFLGGVTSPTLPWVLIIPLLSFFYLGFTKRLSTIVFVMFTVNFALFFAAVKFIEAPENDMSVQAMQAFGLVSTAGTAMYVAMMAFFYAKVLASQTELEQEMRQHFATAAELRRATEEAERAGAAKADFLAKMSHELRTPLNAVIGYSQLLLEDAQDEGDSDVVTDLEKIHSAGHHLLKLVNEVLDLIKIDSGKMELYCEPVDLGAMLADIVARHSRAAAAKGIEIAVESVGPLGRIVADDAKLRHAVEQLVDNAVKFTTKGRITVSARRTANGSQDDLTIRVIDTGVGISENHLANLFEQFHVANDASASKYGGTGLGLALAQRLCRLMGGDVTVESRVGEGSCFTITLPAEFKQPQSRFAPRHEDDASRIASGVPGLRQSGPSLAAAAA